MFDFKHVPIVQWPGKQTPAWSRQRSRFSARYSQTLALLERELEQLGATNVVLQVALEGKHIRQDGKPRAGAPQPTHPGVILSFNTPQGALSFPCDTYDRWEDNIRAIALTLEHLRAIDRYGVTKHGEQYTGWKALPPAPASPSNGMTPDEAAAYIARHAGGECGKPYYSPTDLLNSRTICDVAYHRAARNLHPDTGGSHEDFVRLQHAAEVLKAR
jgi:hypothetical protein